MVTCSGLERKLPCTVTPEPMLTRSSDWVEFALIYENNLDSVKNISEELEAYGPFSIKKKARFSYRVLDYWRTLLSIKGMCYPSHAF